VKADPVGRGPGRWTARAVQVRDEDGRKGAFPLPDREMRKKKIPISVFAAPVLRDLFQANVLALLLKERMISPELVERMREWRHSGFHAYVGEGISDIEDALRVGLYMVRGPAATSRLCVDPAQEPKVRHLAKGTVPDHGEEWTSFGHRDYDYLEWIARLTSHIPDRAYVAILPIRYP